MGKELPKVRELEHPGMRKGHESRPEGSWDLPYRDLAAAPGRQRTPTSRAWSWPRCGPATGGAGGAEGDGAGPAGDSNPACSGRHMGACSHTTSLPTPPEDPRPTSDTPCWLRALLSPLKGSQQGWGGECKALADVSRSSPGGEGLLSLGQLSPLGAPQSYTQGQLHAGWGARSCRAEGF